MNKSDKPLSVTDDELILLYYAEHDDPTLAATVANDPGLSERFEQLSRSLQSIDSLSVPTPDQYGAQVWQKIGPQLESTSSTEPSLLNRFWRRLSQPRFSMANVGAMLAIGLVAFWLGGRSQLPGQSPAELMVDGQRLLNIERLLASRVADHLTATDMLITQVNNQSSTEAAGEADWAAQLLLSNRIYRQAANSAGHARLALLLDEIEPLLLDLAHADAQTSLLADSPGSQDLLLRVRVMNQKLARANQPPQQANNPGI